jgi:uncharacterized protein
VTPLPAALADGERRLRGLLSGYRSVSVAFSGGIDSAYLSWVATDTLGASVLCVTADSPSYPDRHRTLALTLARDFRLRHEIVGTGEFDLPEYRANPTNRCYYCKQELYATLVAMATRRGFAVVADGNNADDRGDYRPGRQAARELGVRSPLDEAELTKAQIRELARHAGLPTWDEPASACLSSRIPYHSPVTREKLWAIEQAEEAVRALGFRVCRVRHHEGAPAGPGRPPDVHASLEIGWDELPRALEPAVRARIVEAVLDAGYHHVTIDPRGYRTGSLNEGIVLQPV